MITHYKRIWHIVLGPSAKPDSIILDLPLSGVENGQYVSFLCEGNVGKPPGNLFGKNYDMEDKVLLFTQMSVLRQLRYLVIVLSMEQVIWPFS
jgi:hypothetical protein